MKKLAKVFAGLLIGLVVVSGVKTEAMAGSQSDVLKLLGYSQTKSNPYLDYAGLKPTGYAAYDKYMSDYAQALYMYKYATGVYEYMGNVTQLYQNNFLYLGELAKQTQPYVDAFGGTNPYVNAMTQLADQYQVLMNQFYQALYYGY